MRDFFLKNKNWIGYVLYGVILLPVFLYIMFPSNTIKDFIEATVQAGNPGISIDLKKASLSFPFGLRLKDVDCRIREFPEETAFMAEKIIIRPKLWSLLSKNHEYGFYCEAYDGTITGLVNVMENSEAPSLSLSTEFENIHIKADSRIPAVIKDSLKGTLAGDVTFKGEGLFDPDGTGKASLTLSGGAVDFSIPFLNIDVIDLKEVVIKAELKDRTLNITDAGIKGDEFLGRTSGTISLKDPLHKSRLNLKCSIEPTAAFMQDSDNADGTALLLKQALTDGSLSLAITGTLEKPSFKLD